MWDAIAGAFKLVTGILQEEEGKKKLSGATRPEYKRPSEINLMQQLAASEYADPYMPGEGVMQDRISQSTNIGYEQAAAAGNPFAAIAALDAQNQASKQNLAMQSARYQRQDLESYYRALQTAAPYTDMEFQMNQFAPYAEASQEARDMIGAGTKNLYGGMSDLGGIADAWTNQGLQNSGKSKKGNTNAVYDQYNQKTDEMDWGQYDDTDVSGEWDWNFDTTG